VTGCRLSATKKQQEERLDEMESRLSKRASVDGERQQLRADMDASVERRLTQLQEQVRQETADKCLQLEKVRTVSGRPRLSHGHRGQNEWNLENTHKTGRNVS